MLTNFINLNDNKLSIINLQAHFFNQLRLFLVLSTTFLVLFEV